MTLYIVAADRNPGVAALAQGPKVAFVVRAAVCKRQDVVHFLRRCQPTFAFTLLTQWMCLNITSTNPSPCAAVSLIGVWIPLIFVVMMLGDLPVLVAVTTIGQATTPRIGARTLRLSRHPFISLSGKRKAPEGNTPRPCSMLFCYCNTNTMVRMTNSDIY